MRKFLAGAALLLCAAPLWAQGGPPGGGDGGFPGGGPPGGGPPGGDKPGGRAPRPVKPVKRESLDKAVTVMFRQADANRDGLVTIAEFRAIVEGRRDETIRARFAAIDANHDGSLSLDEFLGWQRTMGSVASSEADALGQRGGQIAEMIMPKLGDDPEDRMLAALIEPLNATTIAQANSNYDAGVSLDELLAFEHKRFDAADTDHDGAVSMEEMRSLMPPGKRGGGGFRPANGDGPPCPPDRGC